MQESNFNIGDIVTWKDQSNGRHQFWTGGKARVTSLSAPNLRMPGITVEILESIPANLENTPVGKEIEDYLKNFEVIKSSEAVEHPSHYGGGDNPYEVIKVAEAWGLDKDAYLFNVIKYVGRSGKKDDELEDLEKGAFYLARKIANLKKALAEAK